ncbi:MAG: FecR domain-containing protein, partial [Verrucomicrobia bacterium]|nr:FecR domain-containing protein [Verrucomicrobiota bacterium]
MNAKSSVKTFLWAVAVALLTGSGVFLAKPLGQATITSITSDVRCENAAAGQHTARLNESLRDGDLLRTGPKSQVEIRFADRTVVRLGSDTVFTFDSTACMLEIKRGLLLFDLAKDSAGARVITPAGLVTATTTGAGFVSHRSPLKVISLSGILRVTGRNGTLLASVGPGQMFIEGTTPRPMDVDLSKMTGSLLRPGLLNNQIAHSHAIHSQQRALAAGRLEQAAIQVSNGASLVAVLPAPAKAPIAAHFAPGVQQLEGMRKAGKPLGPIALTPAAPPTSPGGVGAHVGGMTLTSAGMSIGGGSGSSASLMAVGPTLPSAGGMLSVVPSGALTIPSIAPPAGGSLTFVPGAVLTRPPTGGATVGTGIAGT